MKYLGFYRHAAGQSAISVMLVMAVLLVALFPLHFHLHHEAHAPAEAAEHSTDIHFYADASGIDHHGDSHSLEPVSDTTSRGSSAYPPVFAALLCLVLLWTFAAQGISLTQLPHSLQLPRFNRHSSPPLRAPPRS